MRTDFNSVITSNGSIVLSFANYSAEKRDYPRLNVIGITGLDSDYKVRLVRKIKQRKRSLLPDETYKFSNTFGWRHPEDMQIANKINRVNAIYFYATPNRPETEEVRIWSEYDLEFDLVRRDYTLSKTLDSIKKNISFADMIKSFITNELADKTGQIFVWGGNSFETVLSLPNVNDMVKQIRLDSLGLVIVDKNGKYLSNILSFSTRSFVEKNNNEIRTYLKI